MTLGKPTWRRVFWLVMMAGHAPALVMAWRGVLAGDGSLLRLIVLAASEVVFLLKLLDVAWLRIGRGWRGNLAVIMGIVLLHAGVLRQLVVHGIDNPNAWCVLFVGSGSTALGYFAVRRPRPVVRSRPPRRVCPSIRELLARSATALLPPRYLLLVRACSVNRAPPALRVMR